GVVNSLSEIGARQVYVISFGIVGGYRRRAEQGVAYRAAPLVVLVTVARTRNTLRFGHAPDDVHSDVEPRLDIGLHVGSERYLLVTAVLDDTVLVEKRTGHRIGGAFAAARDGKFVTLERRHAEKFLDMVHVGQSVEVTAIDEVALYAAHRIVVACRFVINRNVIGR